MKKILITVLSFTICVISSAQTFQKKNFISINPGVSIYDDNGLLGRAEIELGREFNQFFSASAVLGFESNMTTKSQFSGSGYDISANGYFNFLKPQLKSSLRLGGGIGFGKYSQIFILPVTPNNGTEPLWWVPVQSQLQGVLFNLTLEGTRKISSKFKIGLKYTYRIFESDSQIPVMLKLQFNL
jgi:hypothetical protein